MAKKVELHAAQRLVTGMTYKRGDAESKITDLGYEFAEHVMKVYLFPHTSYVDGCLNELRAWFDRIYFIGSRLKGGKSFSAQHYTEFLFESISWKEHRFPDRVESIVERNPKIKVRKDLDVPKMLEELRAFYLELGKLLEQDASWSVAQKLLMKYVAD
jgi:hypothetical protein